MSEAPALRSIRDIVRDLSQPLPASCTAQKTVKGATLTYLHWWTVAQVLDHYAPGWHGQVVHITRVEALCTITYRVTIPCIEGAVSREATGQEEEEEKMYGDPSSNAEAMAFKRAAAKFGVGQWLYDKRAETAALATHLAQTRQADPDPTGTTPAEQNEYDDCTAFIAALFRLQNVPLDTQDAWWLRMEANYGRPIPLATLRGLRAKLERRAGAEASGAQKETKSQPPRRDNAAWDTLHAHRDNAELPEGLLDDINLALDNPETSDRQAFDLAQEIGHRLRHLQRATHVE